MSNSGWLYAKIFIRPSRQDAEALLLDQLRPLTRSLLGDRLIERFFYIVYGEGGHHVRLRLQISSSTPAEIVKERLEKTLASPIDGPGVELGGGNSQPRRFSYDHYEPEYEKYGGEAGLRISESHFQDSSATALAVLESERQRGLTRAQAGLLLIDALFREFVNEPALRARFYFSWRDHWMASVPEADRSIWLEHFDRRARRAKETVSRLLAHLDAGSGGAIGQTLPVWRSSCHRTASDLLALEKTGQLEASSKSVVQNYVHMLCNRLDVPIFEEAFLLHLLGRGLEEAAKP